MIFEAAGAGLPGEQPRLPVLAVRACTQPWFRCQMVAKRSKREELPWFRCTVRCCCTNGEQRGVLCKGGVRITGALSVLKSILCTNSALFASRVRVG